MLKQSALKILGLEKETELNDEKINSAYKELIKKYHPDTYKFGQKRAKNKSIKIIKAYNVLLGKEKEELEKSDLGRNKITLNRENLWLLVGGIVLTIILFICFLIVMK